MDEFNRICPECKKIIYYKTLKIKKTADKLNRICKSCSKLGERSPNYRGKACYESTREKLRIVMTGKKRTEDHKRKISESMIGERNHMFGRTGILSPNYGRKLSEEHKQKLSVQKQGKRLSEEHRKAIGLAASKRRHSAKTKNKMRISKINHIINKNGGIKPQYNKNAYDYFKILENKNNWDGYFGRKNNEYHLRELGYFLDYYEPNLNIVIEYDEPKHYYTDNTLKEHDIIRMNEIKKFLKCKFFRYNERIDKLIQY